MYSRSYATQGKVAAKAIIAADPDAPKDLVDMVSQNIDLLTKVDDNAIIQVNISSFDIGDTSVDVMVNINTLTLTPAPAAA